jgi:general secretion pathway protein C
MATVQWAKEPIASMNAASWLEGLPASEKWRALLERRGPLAATVLLAALLAMQAGAILVDLTSGGPGSATPPLPASAPALARHMGTNVGLITGADLFGKVPVAAPPPQDAATAPQSTIPLLLTGVVAREDPAAGLAIIGQASGQASKVYTVGESVPGGAKLHGVYADRAVIDRDGHLEALFLPKATGSVRGQPFTAVVQPEPAPADRMRRIVTEQPGLIASIMRLQPQTRDNKLLGFQVFPGRNHQAFTRLGLRPGDVVTAINGTVLDDPARGQEILNTLDSSSEAHVTVLRNGQPHDLTLNMAQVAQEAEALSGPPGTAPQGASPQGLGPPEQQPPTTSPVPK